MKGRLADAWRLSVGTLTAIPVRPPGRVDRDTAGLAMVLAPLAVVPLGVLVALVLWGGHALELAAFPIALVAVGALALGSRAFHLDGLADTADGLTASYERERSLEVMKSGSVGPAGAVALFIVLMIQASALASLSFTDRGMVLAGLLVCVSRVALTITCLRGVPAARHEGLGASHAGSVPSAVAVASWLAAGAASAATVAWADDTWWHVLVGFGVGAAVVGLLVLRAVRRLGGVTGDVFGAAIELTLAILLISVEPQFVSFAR